MTSQKTEQTGFHPTSQVKKILGKYGNYAYIYNDGVVVVEKREIKLERDVYKTVDLWHFIPCDTRIRVADYAENRWSNTYDGLPKVRCLVVHYGETICNGFDRVEVAFNGGSLGTGEKSLVINTVNFNLGDFKWRTMEISENRSIIYGSNVTIQPNPHDHWSPRLEDVSESISNVYTEMINRNYTCMLHGELPVTAQEKRIEEERLLTVSN